MRRRVSVSIWVIAAAIAAFGFVTYEAYLKPCQSTLNGPCNTTCYSGCCPNSNLVCYQQKCTPLSLLQEPK